MSHFGKWRRTQDHHESQDGRCECVQQVVETTWQVQGVRCVIVESLTQCIQNHFVTWIQWQLQKQVWLIHEFSGIQAEGEWSCPLSLHRKWHTSGGEGSKSQVLLVHQGFERFQTSHLSSERYKALSSRKKHEVQVLWLLWITKNCPKPRSTGTSRIDGCSWSIRVVEWR